MRAFEADCYVEGWDACIIGAERSENPYKRPFGSAWDSYRRNAWDSGWFHCNRNEPFVDPRKPKRNRRRAR